MKCFTCKSTGTVSPESLDIFGGGGADLSVGSFLFVELPDLSALTGSGFCLVGSPSTKCYKKKKKKEKGK